MEIKHDTTLVLGKHHHWFVGERERKIVCAKHHLLRKTLVNLLYRQNLLTSVEVVYSLGSCLQGYVTPP